MGLNFTIDMTRGLGLGLGSNCILKVRFLGHPVLVGDGGDDSDLHVGFEVAGEDNHGGLPVDDNDSDSGDNDGDEGPPVGGEDDHGGDDSDGDWW